MSFWRITIDTNPDVCNLQCKMCDTHSIYNKNFKPTRKTMPVALLEKVIKKAKEAGVVEVIPTTMGEPLLYPDFERFLELLELHDLRLNLTTNGTFPRGGVEKWGDSIFKIASDVKISINSCDSKINESIMGKANTKKAFKDIEKMIIARDNARKNGNSHATLTLQVTFMRSNLDEMEKIIQYAIAHTIDRVKGHQLWVTWPELQGESILNNPELIEKWNSMIDSIDKYRSQIKLENFSKISKRKNSTDVSDSLICPFLSREIWVGHDGSFNICCAPSDLRKKIGSFGGIQTKSITDVYNSCEYQDLLKHYKENAICKKCSLRRAQ